MNFQFAERMAGIPRSFIREILKVASDPSFISFAGGLPNKDLFPVEELQKAADDVFRTDGKTALQYSTTEGYLPLRKFIAKRYKEKKGIDISPEHILITTGSQQGLDLLGKIFINEGDNVLVEEPAYLGAIQALSVFKPLFTSVPLHHEGMDLELLPKALMRERFKLFYAVPNFQNPSGITYSDENRLEVAQFVKKADMVMIEDDPYGELRFLGEQKKSFKQIIPENVVMLGSFSKIIAPSFRVGWVAAPAEVFEKLVIAKQAADLHTSYIGQRIIHKYLEDNILDNHIAKIISAYGHQREAMVNALMAYMPNDVNYTMPEGGMFLWITLPHGKSAMNLFNKCIEKKLAFVPGNPFYINKTDVSTLRLNFSCSDEKTIFEGIERMAETLKEI
jgi:2-aminoadipate transaminase